jgi:hypothetical protein
VRTGRGSLDHDHRTEAVQQAEQLRREDVAVLDAARMFDRRRGGQQRVVPDDGGKRP